MNHLPKLLIFILLAFSATGCASLSLVSSTLNTTLPAKHYQKLLVVGITEKPEMRQVFEEVFASELRERGLNGIASYSITGINEKPSRDSLAEAVKKSQSDGVIVTRLVSFKRNTEVKTGFIMTDRGIAEYYGFSDFYNIPVTYATFVHQPVEVLRSTKASFETNLFDAVSGRLVWTGRSTAVDPEGTITISRELSRVVFREMSKDGLL